MNTISSYEAFEARLSSSDGERYELDIRSPAGEGRADLEPEQLSSLHELLATTLPKTAESEGMRDLGHETEAETDEDAKAPGWRDLGFGIGAETEASVSGPSAEELGKKLRQIVLPSWAQRLFRKSLEALDKAPQRGLAIRFHFDLSDGHQAKLARLPWELVAEDHHFLAHSVETPILRFLDLPGRTRPFKKPTRLGILLVVPEPDGVPPLEGLFREADGVQTAWEQDNVYVRIIRHEDGSDLSFEERLREMLRREEFHVLHFMGHGIFDPRTQEGMLCFEGRDRTPREVSGKELAGWLLNHRSLRLVVLNACETGRVAGAQPFAGVATALLQGGIPAVLAMQDRMPDRLAVVLGQVLYQELAAGAPVEAALSQARLELAARSGAASQDWSIPVLLSRTPSIIAMPARISEALTRWWTLLATAHFLWVFVFFLRNRSLMPGLDSLIESQVAALLGVFFGLPLLYVSLYCAIEYAKNHQPVREEEEKANIWRRIALRLPVTFHTRVQGRRINENTYQIAFFLLYVVGALTLQGVLFSEVLKASVWLQREEILHSSTRYEALSLHVPFGKSVFNDNYRLGSLKGIPAGGAVIDNTTYFPFWGSWGLFLAELIALGMAFYLLRLLTHQRPGREGQGG